MRRKTLGYIVVDMERGKSRPLRLAGDWLAEYDCTTDVSVTMFSDRAAARAAIQRTDKYWDASKMCQIIRVTGDAK